MRQGGVGTIHEDFVVNFVYSDSIRAPSGAQRRTAIMATMLATEGAAIPVNNKWQASSVRDPDLACLLKKGKLRQIRAGGSRQQTQKSAKRQTYLVLA